MATAPFVIERKVSYHGIWNTGLQITDQFVQAIATQYSTKPSCPTFVTMSSSAITLVVFSRNGDQEIRRDHIAFEALREVAANTYDPRCLMILYINNKNRYSVIVCSCPDSKQTLNIALAYKTLKNYKLMNPPNNKNWILRKTDSDESDGSLSPTSPTSPEDDSASIRSRAVSGVMNETFAFLNNHEDGGDDDVFSGLEAVEREAVDGDDVNAASFHAGLQVNLEDQSHRGGSISSRSSFVSFKDIQDELTVVQNGQHDQLRTSDVAKDQYFVKETEENKSKNDATHADTDKEQVNGNSNFILKLVSVEETEHYEFHSVASQTVAAGGSGGSRRYKKRPGSTHGSNMYKDMAAQRKSSTTPSTVSSTSTSTLTNGTNGNGSVAPSDLTVTSNSMGSTANFLRARPASFNTGSFFKPSRPASQQLSSTTVTRSIEDVYRTHSRNRNRATMSSSGRGSIVSNRSSLGSNNRSSVGSNRGRRVVVYSKQ